MLLDALLAQVQRIVVAPRWEYPDAPGSAHVPDLASQLTPEDFVALRATTAGRPEAIASRRTFPNVSVDDGMT